MFNERFDAQDKALRVAFALLSAWASCGQLGDELSLLPDVFMKGGLGES